MPLPKIKAADAVKSDDGNDSLDTIIRQAIGKEPFLSFNRATDSPVQWIQWLHALDQQDLPGWPLLAPLKIQMQKCEKCSREFCSTINYRRHMRLHRRKLNLDKDSNTKNRGLLQAFWDKVSVEEAMEIMSFDDISLEGVAGSSIVKALISLIRKPGFTSLPQAYVKSGSALLDIVQGIPSKFPISSQELFSIFDDASENTFLCAGTAESLQKYVFDGEAGKTGLEMRNLIACTSFLAEQKLVRACLAVKDAEALRYQKLLVEEEEAAQKRQAALLEKKKQKKLRKELRARQLATAENDDSLEESSSPSTSSPVDALESTLELLEISHDATPSLEPADEVNIEGDIDKDEGNEYLDLGAQQNAVPDSGASQNVDHRTSHRNSRRHVVNSRWQAPKTQRNLNGFHISHNYQTARPGVVQKHAFSRESRAPPNGVKVWTPKPKSETDDDISKARLLIEEQNLPGQDKKHEVLIGSIPVTIGNRINQEREGKAVGATESRALVHSLPDENGTLESAKGEVIQRNGNPTVKFWRPVTRQERGDKVSIKNSSGAQESGGSGNVVQQAYPAENISNGREDKSDSSVEGGQQGGLKFSSHAAEAFLSQRWKEAITSDHVKLVLFPEVAKVLSGVNDDSHEAALPSKLDDSGVLHSAENRLPIHAAVDSTAPVKSKVRAKSEKVGKVKYIRK